jgi:hypothetical protein
MDPEKRKRARERTERWARTDPNMRALRERIEYYQARIAERERLEREGGSGDRSE